MQLETIKTHINRKLFLSVIILLLVALSSLKVVDDYADSYTTDAITNAAITYATARGINALVSMMQTTTIEAGVGISGSISVGQLLDPLNDLIERFSSIMTVVLASLAGQKVLLLISSHQLFQILIMFFGVLSILMLQTNKISPLTFVFKSFLLLVFIRFSLGIAVSMNAIVDTTFLMNQTDTYDNEIKILKQDISSFNSESGITAEEIQGYREKLKTLAQEKHNFVNYSKTYYPQEKSRLDSKVNEIKAKIEREKEKLNLVDKYNPFNENSVIKGYKKELDQSAIELKYLNKDNKLKKKRISEINQKILKLNKMISGEPDGFFENLKRKSTAILNSVDVDKIEQKVNRSINNFMSLMALYILKTILFPLFFFYVFIRILKYIWNIENSKLLQP